MFDLRPAVWKPHPWSEINELGTAINKSQLVLEEAFRSVELEMMIWRKPMEMVDLFKYLRWVVAVPDSDWTMVQ